MVVRAHVQKEQDLDSMPRQHMGSPIQSSTSLGCDRVIEPQDKLGDQPAHTLLLLLP